MKRQAVDNWPCDSGMDNADRIRELLREIREARGQEIRDTRDRKLRKLWPELEHRVAREMGLMVDEELAVSNNR